MTGIRSYEGFDPPLCKRCGRTLHVGSCKGAPQLHLHTPEIEEKAHESRLKTLRARADARRRAIRNRLRYEGIPAPRTWLWSMRQGESQRLGRSNGANSLGSTNSKRD